MNSEKQTIIIIGAGAAGLKAAKILSKKFKVIILEATDRLGGRIATMNRWEYSKPVETGAEFIHGDLPLTFKLIKKAGLEYEKHADDFFRVKQGEWHSMDESFKGWDELLRKMKKERHDISLLQFLDKHYPGQEHAELRKNAQSFAEGFNLADIHTAGIKGLHSEWSVQQQEAFHIKGGYCCLIDYLVGECKSNGVQINMECIARTVEWKKGSVRIITIDGREFFGDKLVITVSAGIMQRTIGKSVLKFKPLLDDYISAYRQIGYGPVLKIIIEFKDAFWKNYKDRIGYIISDETIPTWWPRSIEGSHFITGWKGGPQVLSYRDYEDEALLQMAFESLSSIFKLSIENLKEKIIEARVFNWQKNEFAEGGYSYSMPESENAKKLLNKPVEGTVFFAGEALYYGGAGGTVEAALNSGRKVARLIKKDLV